MNRNDQPFMPGGFQVIPPAIKTIIFVNVLVFLLQNTPFGQVLTTVGALWPLGTNNPEGYSFQIWQPLTYMFLHGGFAHIFFNMFALWIFGAEIENYWGTKHFTIYYLVCGIGAAALNLLTTVGTMYPTVGASGAIYGVLLAFGMMFPERYIFLYFLVPVKAKYFVAGYAFIEFISGLGGRGMGSGSDIAHFAHLGGMIVGFVYIIIMRNEWSIGRLFRKISGAGRKKSGPQLWKGGDKKNDNASEAEIDAILDKISSRGYESLTAEEKRKLLNAGGRR
ncbi:MAG: rhomboid family intramembrane serine protease [Chlorobiaceae bacterium]|nr:rhomboid family intramembrane serine protease [Chlorobiaceae bacterium]